MARFDIAQKHVHKAEGGYQADPADMGNYHQGVLIGTKYGISASKLAEYMKRMPTQQDMRDLKYKHALAIYRRDFWDKNNLGRIRNQSLANLIYDGAINHGNPAMRRIVADAVTEVHGVDVSPSKVFSEKGIALINESSPKKLFDQIKFNRWERYKKSKNFARYGTGWKGRLARIEYASAGGGLVEFAKKNWLPITLVGLAGVTYVLIRKAVSK